MSLRISQPAPNRPVVALAAPAQVRPQLRAFKIRIIELEQPRTGAMVRIVHQWRDVGFLVDAGFNETFVGRHDGGRVVFGVQLGHWPRPRDLQDKRNPLGTDVPRVHYERLERVR